MCTHKPVFKADSCSFYGFGEGLWMWGTVDSSYLRNCVIEGVGAGATDPAAMGFNTALTVVGDASFAVENCDIKSSGDVGVFSYWNTDGVTIKDSRITGGRDYGVLNWDGGNLRLECTEISHNGDSLAELWADGALVDLVGGRNEFTDSTGTLIYAGDPAFVDMEGGDNDLHLLTANGCYLRSGDTSAVWDVTMNAWSPVEPTDSNFYNYLSPSTPNKWIVDSSLADFVACDVAGGMSVNLGNLLLAPPADRDGIYSTPPPNTRQDASAVAEREEAPASKFAAKTGQVKSEVKDAGLATKQSYRAALIKQHNEELSQWRQVKALSQSASKPAAVMKFLNDHPASSLAPAAIVTLASLASGEGKNMGISEFLLKNPLSLPIGKRAI